MIGNSIKNYFLDKPGTFEDEEKSCITLNLASEKVAELHKDYVDLKLDEISADILIKKGHHIKTIKTEGKFTWQQIPIDEISLHELYDLIDQSYESVIHTLPEDEQKEILDLEW